MCMELQLGLALPTPPPIVPIKMFDLNSYGYELREPLGSNALSWPLLNLGSSDTNININININNNGSSSSSSSCSSGGDSKKRGFDEVLLFDDDENRVVPKTLPLFLCTNQPNDEDDPGKDLEDNSCSAIFKKNGEGLVGWPPVKTWRKKLRRQIPNGGADNNRMVEVAVAENGFGRRASNSMYVKVKMEGVAIARKIDLSVHHSFESLTSTLMTMFGISAENRENFKLTYQDRDGDWMLAVAEDVPWRTFIRSLKCLKLVRGRG